MCVELDRILGREPSAGAPFGAFCSSSTFDLTPPSSAQAAANLRRWYDAEKHRWGCKVCSREKRAERAAANRKIGNQWRAAVRTSVSRERPRRSSP